MLLSWNTVLSIVEPIRGVIHIGAHEAEERDAYIGAGIENIIWIEADPKLAVALRSQVPELVFNYAVCDEDHSLRDFYLAENGHSSSLLKPKEHLRRHPRVKFGKVESVQTITLDTLLEEHRINRSYYNFISMDIQGAELLALHGMKQMLPYVDTIYMEVNFIEMYTGCALVGEADTFLSKFGFSRVLTHDTKRGWGDALYIRS